MLWMTTKTVKLNPYQLSAFDNVRGSMVSMATLPIPGVFPQQLKNVGINERGTLVNRNVGHIITAPSGSELVFETVSHNSSENLYKGDLHVVNFELGNITSYFRGWGTWIQHYGDGHHADKSFLEAGTIFAIEPKKFERRVRAGTK